MYRCENCDSVVPAGQKQLRVTVETRPKTYRVWGKPKGRGRKSRDETPIVVGQASGYEIARELQVCHSCARELVEDLPRSK